MEKTLVDAERRTLSKSEKRRQAFLAVARGAIWSVPIIFFAPYGTLEQCLTLALIYAISVACVVQLMILAPPIALISVSVIAISGLSVALVTQLWMLAVGICFYYVISVLGLIEVARVHYAARIAQSGMAEKQEVVSLLLREFEENEADWLWEIDPTRRLRNVSPRFAYSLGCSQSEAEGRALLELIAGANWKDGESPVSLHDLADRLKNQENFSNFLVQVTIKGEDRWWELSGTPLRNEKGRFSGFRGVGSDVTERRQSSEKIEYLARFDTLTSLPNRLQLTESLGEALHYAAQWRSRCALLMIDLDRFKAVNDSLGHLTGDKLLAQVSSRLQALMNENLICGRLGGDEFAIVIRDASHPDFVRTVAREVIDALSEPYKVDQHTLYVGASVGSAIGPRDGRTVEELMRNADLALYRAKDAGGGEHCKFEPSLHASAEERRQLEASLRAALTRDEFVLHYQPVVDAHDHSIVSFEALVRWDSAEHGFVSPGKFIPLAEDTRLIVPIGRWVLFQACQEATNWPDHVKVNVNVSPEQLLEPEFHQDVVDALSITGLRPHRLEVEVTESIFMRDATIARNSLEQIMALGCSVALDDFGTGYSSLGYLRKLRFSTIKVDRTFVTGAAQGSNESLAIINAVVAMAKNMRMTTTAEGVETSEEAELIRSLGCDKIQGFYFGRPMCEKDALKLFNSERKIA
ncbi:MAG: EAL domain-containing protein [Erythrobacter sp.]